MSEPIIEQKKRDVYRLSQIVSMLTRLIQRTVRVRRLQSNTNTNTSTSELARRARIKAV